MDETERLTRLRALAHPARLQILSLLTGAAMSAAEVARELSTTQANASYHLRRLAAVGEVELVEQVTIRGGQARRYRCPPIVDEPQKLMPDGGEVSGAELRGFYAVLARELQRRSVARRPDGAAINTDAELWVSPQVWQQAVAQVTEVTGDLHRRAVPPRTPGAVRVSVTVALFGMDPTARPAEPEDSS